MPTRNSCEITRNANYLLCQKMLKKDTYVRLFDVMQTDTEGNAE